MRNCGAGLCLICFMIALAAAAPQEKREISAQPSAANEDTEQVAGTPKLNCVNSTLLIYLENEDTQFRILSVNNEEFLFINYSVEGHKDIFNLVDATFNYLFPDTDFAVRVPHCDIGILKRTYEDGGVMIRADLLAGDKLLELGSVGKSKTLTSEESHCARITGANVDASPDLDVQSKDRYNFTALHWAAFFNNVSLAKRLIEKGANLNAPGPMNVTPLKAAVATGDLNLVKLLVEHGADINSATFSGMVPLLVAVNTGRLNILRYLIKQGANLNITYSAMKSSPLHIGADVGRVRIVRELVEAGIDKDVRNRDGATPLHLAARHAHVDVVKYLISLGADVNARDNWGRTPLVRATDNSLIWDNAFETIKLLIESGSDVNARDRNGQSALSVLSVAGNENVNNYLKSKGLMK